MPGAAILAGGVDEVLPLDAIASVVLQCTAAPR
jgi:chemotaxis response regulator CheB